TEHDLAGGPERTVERERADAVAIAGHPARLAAVAAEDEAAQLAGRPAPGEVGGAVAEVEPRPHVPRLVGAVVLEPVPARVVVESLGHPVERQVVEPELAGSVGALHHAEQAE